MNKRGLIKLEKKEIWLVLALSIFFIILSVPQISAATKANQYFTGNLTCEPFIDTIEWTAIGKKGGSADTYYNWSMDTPCVGTKDCDMGSIYNYVRYLNVGDSANAGNLHGYAQIGNKSESPVTDWTNKRYSAALNSSDSVPFDGGYTLRWECGAGNSPNTCDTLRKGFDNYTKNYSIHIFGYSAGANLNTIIITDVFNIRYDWCWTPLIYDANVSLASADYEQTFTFTIKVTNPNANTSVQLWTRPAGGTWVQGNTTQYCNRCANVRLNFSISNYSTGDIGNREFKFNATDGTYNIEAWASGTTNECLDGGNDCVFTVTDVTVAEGTPVLVNEKVNGVQSGATGGWGTNWTFVVDVNNPADGAGDIELNFSVNTGSGFVLRETEICSEAQCSTPQTFTFYIDNFTCSDISPTANAAQYKFTATNLNGTESVTQTFTIDKDNIQFIYEQGNNSIANRSGDQTTTFILRVNDTDKAPSGAWVNGTNITFSVQRNSLAYYTDSNFVVLTDAGGYANFSFNATCDQEYVGAPKFLVGAQKWKAETLSTTQCYKAVSTEEFNTSVQGDIILDYVTPNENEEIYQEGSVVFLGATTDDCTDALTATVVYE
ncbi:MAG: hypothetical protein ABIJ14_00645, partial [Nanoarchaeota archaeon]